MFFVVVLHIRAGRPTQLVDYLMMYPIPISDKSSRHAHVIRQLPRSKEHTLNADVVLTLTDLVDCCKESHSFFQCWILITEIPPHNCRGLTTADDLVRIKLELENSR